LIRYYDASALAKRYITERYSDKVDRMLSDGIAVTCRISEAEIASALARRQREGDIKVAERDRLMKLLEQDVASLYVIEISREICALACSLLMRHKLRAADALHLASALFLARRSEVQMQFVAFDHDLNEAAQREGFVLPDYR
jgi:predicted nucleic acid-binding protein